jgi:hypothetical protein
MAPPPRQHAERGAERRAAQRRRRRPPQVVAPQHQPLDALDERAALPLVFQVAQNLADAEQAHRHGNELEALRQLEQAKGVALRPALHVLADGAQRDAEHQHPERLHDGALRQRDRSDQAEHHDGEVFRGADAHRHLGQRRRQYRDQQRRDATRQEGAERRRGQRRPRAPLLRHLVAVERRDDRGGLARQVDQDRGGRAAILRAVEDARHHDHCGDRRQGEGDWQQQRDGRGRPDARQHADQRAEQHADEAEAEILQRQRGGEAEADPIQDIHRVAPSRTRSRASRSVRRAP